MRTAWWAGTFLVILTCSITYQLSSQPLQLERSSGVSGQSEPSPLAQDSDRPLVYKDQARLEDVHSATESKSDRLPIAQDQARLEDVSPASANSKPDRLSTTQDQARLEDTTGTAAVGISAPSPAKKNLSYLAYYAYSEIPPEIKPAATVLDALKGEPRGTPVEEIRRVTAVLGLDFTFMKTVAKIESDFDPKQRTGSYIGLFQLSQKEFEKYGSGDIRDARDNAVAAALKFMTEGILFETFTHKRPTRDDLYLIHQQGVDGASEHISHPKRLAWRSMCATDEGKEKGERWCKRAIWGNTLPAIKRVWKTVDNVTSAAFVGMWQQRVSQFYSRYSEATAN